MICFFHISLQVAANYQYYNLKVRFRGEDGVGGAWKIKDMKENRMVATEISSTAWQPRIRKIINNHSHHRVHAIYTHV